MMGWVGLERLVAGDGVLDGDVAPVVILEVRGSFEASFVAGGRVGAIATNARLAADPRRDVKLLGCCHAAAAIGLSIGACPLGSGASAAGSRPP
ncbi:MAG: hypothetical protein V3V08_25505 [Nannocystaceae bacterium]